jgi:16S rRNA A1518/A1519 N6-dimethyltransferase RsmA/KsgA/DIM1 with predicted DNA glycosylase/AP lyase activity
VRAAFASRRKTILNNLSAPGSPVRRGTADTADLLRAAGIDPRRRAEQVPLAGFTALFEVVSAARGL